MLSLAAGADLLCIGADNAVEQVRAIQAALVDAVRSGRLAEERLAEAAERGRAAARRPRRPSSDRRAPTTALAAGAARSVDRVAGELPVAGRRPGRAGRLGRHHRDRRGALGTAGRRRGRTRVDRRCRDGPLVVQVRDAHRQPDVQATLAAAGAARSW